MFQLQSIFIIIRLSSQSKKEKTVSIEGILTGIFRDLFNLEVPFEQTREEKNCQYCPYQTICSREVGQVYPG